MGTVVIAVRDVYGQTRAYPVNDAAKAFATLIGQKTLSGEHIRVIRELGFAIEIQQPTLSI